MSDFGTMVSVKRRDGEGMTEGDRTLLDKAIHSVQETNQQQDAVGEPLIFRAVGSYRADGGQDLVVVLSEYWLQGIEEGEYDLSVEEILAVDRPKAQAIQERLAAALGAGYDMEIVCGHW